MLSAAFPNICLCFRFCTDGKLSFVATELPDITQGFVYSVNNIFHRGVRGEKEEGENMLHRHAEVKTLPNKGSVFPFW